MLDRDRIFEFLRLKYRGYITNLTWEADQTNYYEDALLEVTAKFNFNRFLTGTRFESLVEPTLFSELFFTAGFKLGKEYNIDGDKASGSDMMQYRIEYIAKPDNSNDLAWYLRWDYGNDYYNINYRNRINRLQFGVIGKKF